MVQWGFPQFPFSSMDLIHHSFIPVENQLFDIFYHICKKLHFEETHMLYATSVLLLWSPHNIRLKNEILNTLQNLHLNARLLLTTNLSSEAPVF